jgi:hypothetical protein
MRIFILASILAAGAAVAQQRAAVVELFTSEGCSSCPPAEAFLGELAQRPDVIALAFHVDYWDGLGWRDRFAIAESTPRQRGYEQTLRLASIYTPQMVIDGTADFVGSDRRRIVDALRRQRSGVPAQIAMQGDSIAVSLGADSQDTPAQVTLIAFERSAVSPIGRGENSGRTLNEYNIVRGVTMLGRYDGRAQTFHADRASLPADATDIAVLVQALGQREMLGAARLSFR